ncbi:TPA: hypothetical protein ACH3X1_002253 [Trebouxia sp. C0004]
MEARGDLTTGQGVGAKDARKVSLTSRPSFKSLPQAVQLDMLEAGSGESSGGPEALLLALGRSLESLPSDIANGVKNGKVSTELLQKYLDLENNVFLKFFLRFAGVLAGLLCNV